MYTLKEACQLTDLTEHTIRFYTDKGLVPNLKRDKNNHRVFDEQSIDWLKGTKYLRELGMSIEEIKQYHTLCLIDGDDAVKDRYALILENLNKALKELDNAKKRVEFLKKKAMHEKQIIEHNILDSKNPHKKSY